MTLLYCMALLQFFNRFTLQLTYKTPGVQPTYHVLEMYLTSLKCIHYDIQKNKTKHNNLNQQRQDRKKEEGLFFLATSAQNVSSIIMRVP